MFYSKSIKEVFVELESSLEGLTQDEIKRRHLKYGKNIIEEKKKISKLHLFISQFKNFIIYILLAASLISLLLNHYTDAIVILIIVFLNAVLGFIQEYKAEKSIQHLKKLQTPFATVIRNKKTIRIPSTELVPGDIILISEGERVPSDSRIIECFSLQTDESSFTGESTPVEKNNRKIINKTIISNQSNMLFSGTVVTRGHGKAIVTATGKSTELGKIAIQISEAPEKLTPLQKKLNNLGKKITYGILIICAFIFLIGLIQKYNPSEFFLTAVALAVAAIPEGLPAIITITLALGTQKMIRQNVLIRRLPSIETLGSTTVICSDKTGTITENKMVVTKIYANNSIIDIHDKGFSINNKIADPKEFRQILEAAYLCNNSVYGFSDPTELALLRVSEKADITPNYKRLDEIPFDSEKKYMATTNDVKGKEVLYLKGAPEIVLSKCRFIINKNKLRILGDSDRKKILKTYEEFALDSLRVLGFAYSLNGKEDRLIFCGLMGMIDPPRKSVKESILECHKAGIKVIMITGDHKTTANTIADLVGIKGETLTGEELDKISDKELGKKINNIGIFARVTPYHKVRIQKALKNKGHIVAMTGDGINDAPALKYSDIGAAVGTSTDVAKEASDIILIDDNFNSIVNAVREGRGIFNNIKRFIIYLFSSNLAEVLVIFLGLMLNFPLPLLAIQILWVNLITDGLPAIALSEEPIKKNIMLQKPRNPESGILTKKDSLNILIPSVIITFGTLFLFYFFLQNSDITLARSAAFTALVVFQLFNVFNMKDGSVLNKTFFENKYLIASVLISLALQFLVINIIPGIFHTSPLTLFNWLIIILTSSSVLWAMELKKRFISS